MQFADWARQVDTGLAAAEPTLSEALRGKVVDDPIWARDSIDNAFDQPHWRSLKGFVSIWPEHWPGRPDDRARALFFRYSPGTFDGNPWTELFFEVSTETVLSAAVAISEFLSETVRCDAWLFPANLQEPRTEVGSFVVDLIHEFGHAVAADCAEDNVYGVAIDGIEVIGTTVSVRGGCHVIRDSGTRPRQRWGSAVVAVAGVVAERMHADREAIFEEPIGIFLEGRSFLSDLEGAISNILFSRERLAMPLALRSQLLAKAVAEAQSLLLSRLPNIEREATRWEERIIAQPRSLLEIRWDTARGALCAVQCPFPTE